jgi:FtsH-binding integral membrane protein
MVDAYDQHCDEEKQALSLSASSRVGFIRKVYLILFAQLAITAVMCAISIMSDSYLIWQY